MNPESDLAQMLLLVDKCSGICWGRVGLGLQSHLFLGSPPDQRGMHCQVESVLWSQDSLGQLLLEFPFPLPSLLPNPPPPGFMAS